MAAEQDDFYIPPERLAELHAIAEAAPHPIPEDAREAPPELAEALRAAALATFANLPVSEQAEFMVCVTEKEREDLLADLSPEQRERLHIELGSMTLTLP